MKYAWLLLFVLGCLSGMGVLKDPVVDMQVKSMDRLADQIQSGKQVDKEDIVASLKSGGMAIKQLASDGSVTRAAFDKCQVEKAELAKQAGEGAMVKWLYYAFIGLIGTIILLIAALLAAKKALKVAAISPADLLTGVIK